MYNNKSREIVFVMVVVTNTYIAISIGIGVVSREGPAPSG